MAESISTSAFHETSLEDYGASGRPGRILLLDHDDLVRDSVARTLIRGGHDVCAVGDTRAAISQLGAQRFDLLVTELRLPRTPMPQLLAEARKLRPGLSVLVMASYAGVRAAVEAVRNGADGYIAKPFEKDELLLAAARTIAIAALRRENRALRLAAGLEESAPALIGAGPKMKRARDAVSRIALLADPVLIRGEAGSGRSHCARLIHAASPRRRRPMLCVQCGGQSGDDATLRARFELATGGSLLLEEVGALSADSQAWLARALAQQAAPDAARLTPQTRILATSSRDLEESILHGGMRKDLFARLSASSIELPALRERREDIPELACHFLHRISRRTGRILRTMEPEALRLLQRHAWPGNLRELELALERADLTEKQPGSLRLSSFSSWLGEMPNGGGRHAMAVDPLDLLPLAEVEKRVILDTLAKFEGHRVKTATALGIGIRTLGIKIKKWREEGVFQEDSLL